MLETLSRDPDPNPCHRSKTDSLRRWDSLIMNHPLPSYSKRGKRIGPHLDVGILDPVPLVLGSEELHDTGSMSEVRCLHPTHRFPSWGSWRERKPESESLSIDLGTILYNCMMRISLHSGDLRSPSPFDDKNRHPHTLPQRRRDLTHSLPSLTRTRCMVWFQTG